MSAADSQQQQQQQQPLKLATHIVQTYDLVHQYASTSKDAAHHHHGSPSQATAIPTLHDLNKLHQELHGLREDLINRRQRIRQDDDRVKAFRARAKGKDKERPQPLQQQQQHINRPEGKSSKSPAKAHQQQQHLQPPSAAASNVSKPLSKVSRPPSVRSSSADLSDAEIPVQRKKDPNKKRKRRPGIPVDSDEEYSDAPTPPTSADPSSKSDPHNLKARKTAPPSNGPFSAPSAGPGSMPPPPSSLVRANSLSDIHHASSSSSSAHPSSLKSSSSARQASPSLASSAGLPSSASLPSGLKLKLNGIKKERSEPPQPASAPSPPKRPLPQIGAVEDFSLPRRPLVPPPPALDPPQPLPQHQEDVVGDFSKCKAGQQVPYNTFTSYIDAYTRALGDDDIAYLLQKSDDYGPFVIPGLGKYYLDAWMDDSYQNDSSTSALQPPPLKRFRPDELVDDKLATEQIFAGPLSERLLSSLSPMSLQHLPTPISDELAAPTPREAQEPSTAPHTNGDLSRRSTVDGGEPSSSKLSPPANGLDASSSSSVPPPGPDTLDMEERVRRELRFLGAFPTDANSSLTVRSREGEVDWSNRRDDEISASLRECQRRLNEQININECRKARLAKRVDDRMARQEFEGLRETLEKQIEVGWQKRQRTVKKKPGLRGAAAAAAAAASAGKPLPEELAASGKRIPLPDQLVASLDKRQRLVEGFKVLFDGEPGRFRGLPEQSIHGDDPQQGAVSEEEETWDIKVWRENGLHSQPDTTDIPAILVQ